VHRLRVDGCATDCAEMEHTGHQVDLTSLVARAEELMGAGLGAPVDRRQGRRLRRGPQRRGGRTSMAAVLMADRRGRTGRRRQSGVRAPDPRGGGGGRGEGGRPHGAAADTRGRTHGVASVLRSKWGGFATGGGPGGVGEGARGVVGPGIAAKGVTTRAQVEPRAW
jgi:hypothetical protein